MAITKSYVRVHIFLWNWWEPDRHFASSAIPELCISRRVSEYISASG